MASNMALKRAAKANRRKVVVAKKRRLELLNDSLTARVLRAAHAPIQYCFVPETLFEGECRAEGPLMGFAALNPSYSRPISIQFRLNLHPGHGD